MKQSKAALVRINGFSKGLHPLQIFSYIAYSLSLVIFALCIYPFFETQMQDISAILYYMSLFVMAVLAIMCSYVDPSDPTIHKEKQARLLKVILIPKLNSLFIVLSLTPKTTSIIVTPATLMSKMVQSIANNVNGIITYFFILSNLFRTNNCFYIYYQILKGITFNLLNQLLVIHVRDDFFFHPSFYHLPSFFTPPPILQKQFQYPKSCVNQFDHHCKWLNNCIGKANYNLFFSLITSVFINSLIYCAFLSYSISKVYSKKDTTLFDGYSEMQYNIMTIAVWSFLVMVGILGIVDLNLLIFHIWLYFNNMTTYEYIISSRIATVKRKRKDSGVNEIQGDKHQDNQAEHKQTNSNHPEINQIANEPPSKHLNSQMKKSSHQQFNKYGGHASYHVFYRRGVLHCICRFGKSNSVYPICKIKDTYEESKRSPQGQLMHHHHDSENNDHPPIHFSQNFLGIIKNSKNSKGLQQEEDVRTQIDNQKQLIPLQPFKDLCRGLDIQKEQQGIDLMQKQLNLNLHLDSKTQNFNHDDKKLIELNNAQEICLESSPVTQNQQNQDINTNLSTSSHVKSNEKQHKQLNFNQQQFDNHGEHSPTFTKDPQYPNQYNTISQSKIEGQIYPKTEPICEKGTLKQQDTLQIEISQVNNKIIEFQLENK